MNPKFLITFVFAGATIGAAFPSTDESVTSHLDRRDDDFDRCYQRCLGIYINKYTADDLNHSMFEPIHGSAFDITGKGVANLVATFWTAAEMPDWLGKKEAAAQLMGCVESVTGRGVVTADFGGKATTKEVTAAVVDEIKATLRKGKTQ